MLSPVLCPLLVIFNPPNCLLTVRKITELYHLFMMELKTTKAIYRTQKKKKKEEKNPFMFHSILYCDYLIVLGLATFAFVMVQVVTPTG